MNLANEVFLYQRPDFGFTRTRQWKTSLRLVSDRSQVEELYRPKWRRTVRAGAHAVGLTVLLAAGTYLTLTQEQPRYVKGGNLLRLPGAVIHASRPSEDPFRISQVLRRYAPSDIIADRIARAVVTEGRRRNLDPALVVGVMLVETDNLNPRAKSFVGARGLMQVMPFHRGRWGCKSTDLYDIESNICHGVSVLADNIKRAPNLRAALQRYNGCVNGTNTPNCHAYSGRVLRATRRTSTQLMTTRTAISR